MYIKNFSTDSNLLTSWVLILDNSDRYTAWHGTNPVLLKIFRAVYFSNCSMAPTGTHITDMDLISYLWRSWTIDETYRLDYLFDRYKQKMFNGILG